MFAALLNGIVVAASCSSAHGGLHFPQSSALTVHISYSGADTGKYGSQFSSDTDDMRNWQFAYPQVPAYIALIPGQPGVSATVGWDGSRRALRFVEGHGFVYFEAPDTTTSASSCRYNGRNAKAMFAEGLGLFGVFFNLTEEGLVVDPDGNGFEEWPDGGKWQWVASSSLLFPGFSLGNGDSYQHPLVCEEFCQNRTNQAAHDYRGCSSLQISTDENSVPIEARLRTCTFGAYFNKNIETNYSFSTMIGMDDASERSRFFSLFHASDEEQGGSHWSDHCFNMENKLLVQWPSLYTTPEECDVAKLSLNSPPSGTGANAAVNISLEDCSPSGWCPSGNCVEYIKDNLTFDLTNWDVPRMIDFRYLVAGDTKICFRSSGGGYDTSPSESLTVVSCEHGLASFYCCYHGQVPAGGSCEDPAEPPAQVNPRSECLPGVGDQTRNRSHAPTLAWFRGELAALPGESAEGFSRVSVSAARHVSPAVRVWSVAISVVHLYVSGMCVF